MADFCRAPHPGYLKRQLFDDVDGSKRVRLVPSVTCTRQPGHDGDHAAFTFRITAPETWPPAPQADRIGHEH